MGSLSSELAWVSPRSYGHYGMHRGHALVPPWQEMELAWVSPRSFGHYGMHRGHAPVPPWQEMYAVI
eukprot:1158484-Pelagomonas_calceolata.AAC.7